MDELLITSIIIYIFILCIIFIVKPKFIYDRKNKSFKSFGFDKKINSFLPYPVFCVLTAILIYLFCLLYFKIVV